MPTAFQSLRRFIWQHLPSLRRPAERTAAELEEMLRANHPWQANFMRQLRLAVERGDMAEAELRFSSGDMWGGSGSVCDVSFLSAKADQQSWRLLIRLVRSFALAGITFAPASSRASIYKEWLRLPGS